MKSPHLLRERLRRQWNAAPTRIERMLGNVNVWPIELPIGLPTARQFVEDARAVREHVNAWRAVSVGRVVWKEAKYREAASAVQLPNVWELSDSVEWTKAADDAQMQREERVITDLLRKISEPWAREIVVRYASDFSELSRDQCLQLVDVAASLEVGCAAGRPLRALSVCGTDSKFFERHRWLITRLLDARYEGSVSDVGLEEFLNAQREHEHWLLIAQLFDGPLSFMQLRVPASALLTVALPCTHVLIVENERSLHQLPRLESTVAILGAGRNLSWLRADWLADRRVAYWGDIDTWGLAMLAQARDHRPQVAALLMNRRTYEGSCGAAVAEPRRFATAESAPQGLTDDERALFEYLASSDKGRLEQEFLPTDVVHQALRRWRDDD